jgi:hypothetical protein
MMARHTDGFKINDVIGFTVHNNTAGHQLGEPPRGFSAEIFAIKMALKYIQMSSRVNTSFCWIVKRIVC